jgi:hypothetical protein
MLIIEICMVLQEVYLERSSDEEIARQLQEMENLFISSVPEETSHFNRPTGTFSFLHFQV